MLPLIMLTQTYLQEHPFFAMAILACRPFVLRSKEECDYKYNVIDTLRWHRVITHGGLPY